MILHASIVADEPRAAAEVLARLLGGRALPIGPGEGTWTAIGPDPVGNTISVLGRGSEFHRRVGQHLDTLRGEPVRHSGFHLLLDTELSEADVLSLAGERDCHAQRATHGAFEVIEFWIDDCQLIEVVTPALGRAYRQMVQSGELRERLAPIVTAGLAKESDNAQVRA